MVKPFSTDGATWFPDIQPAWIYVLHDWTHWAGGGELERWKANAEFFHLLDKYGKRPLLAPLMWFGVTVGAMHFLPTRSRWGYGNKWPNRMGKPGDRYTRESEEPAFEKAMRKAKAPPEIMRKLFASGWR